MFGVSASMRCRVALESGEAWVTERLTPVSLPSSPELDCFDGKKDRKGIKPVLVLFL